MQNRGNESLPARGVELRPTARALLDFQIHDTRILLAPVQIAFDDSALRILAGI